MPRYRNATLASLSRDDLDLLKPDLEPVDLPLRMQLERPGAPVEHVYFPESGIASRVAQVSGLQMEIGLVGHEGMTGQGVVLCAGTTPNELFMQAEGAGHRITADAFCDATRQSPTFLVACLRPVHIAWVQTAQTALANGRNTIEERLARWLLMTQDRLPDAELPLTHEFLALMLGVHRPGVTLALHTLEGARLVRLKRSRIMVVNRAGLIEVAGRTYGTAEAEQDRLFPSQGGERGRRERSRDEATERLRLTGRPRSSTGWRTIGRSCDRTHGPPAIRPFAKGLSAKGPLVKGPLAKVLLAKGSLAYTLSLWTFARGDVLLSHAPRSGVRVGGHKRMRPANWRDTCSACSIPKASSFSRTPTTFPTSTA